MNFPSTVTIAWIANLINAEILGNASAEAKGINEIHKVETGDLAFVDHPKYYDTCLKSAASFIIIDQMVENTYGKTLLICPQPFEAYLTIVKYFKPFTPSQTNISDSAVIGSGTIIMPGSFVGNHVTIGTNSVIHPNVVIYDDCIIGNDVIIHSGSVIGADAFYYNTKKNREVWYKKMLSCGRVIIEDHVEIGANTCVDRGVTHDTIIGQGSKLDNQIQIGHDVVVGRNCIIAAQVGIAGATTVGNGVSIWGQVGVNKTISIGDNVQVLAQSGVATSLPANKVYMGYPAEEAGIKRRQFVLIKRLSEMWDRLQALEKKNS